VPPWPISQTSAALTQVSHESWQNWRTRARPLSVRPTASWQEAKAAYVEQTYGKSVCGCAAS